MTITESGEHDTVLAELELTRGPTIQMTALSMFGFIVAISLIGALYQPVTGDVVSFQFGPTNVGWWTDALNFLVILFLATIFIVPHEWVLGLAIRYYGGEPRYGVGLAHFILPYAYTTTDHEFSRNQFIVVLLTPLVVMSVSGIPLMLVPEWDWLVLPLAANAAGAVADGWMTVTVLGVPAHVRIEDHPTESGSCAGRMDVALENGWWNGGIRSQSSSTPRTLKSVSPQSEQASRTGWTFPFRSRPHRVSSQSSHLIVQ